MGHKHNAYGLFYALNAYIWKTSVIPSRPPVDRDCTPEDFMKKFEEQTERPVRFTKILSRVVKQVDATMDRHGPLLYHHPREY